MWATTPNSILQTHFWFSSTQLSSKNWLVMQKVCKTTLSLSSRFAVFMYQTLKKVHIRNQNMRNKTEHPGNIMHNWTQIRRKQASMTNPEKLWSLLIVDYCCVHFAQFLKTQFISFKWSHPMSPSLFVRSFFIGTAVVWNSHQSSILYYNFYTYSKICTWNLSSFSLNLIVIWLPKRICAVK